MFLKRVCCILAIAICFLNLFSVMSVAARDGEIEAYYVEFKALTSDDLNKPIEIILTDKKDNTVLKYYLYDINNYFSNEAVPIGEYSVSVSVGNVDNENIGYMYDKDLIVEPSPVAIPFKIIVDNYYIEEDGVDDSLSFIDTIFDELDNTEDETTAADDVASGNVLTNNDNLSEQENSEVEKSEKSSLSVLWSLIFWCCLLGVVGAVLWFFYKRR